MKKKILRGLLIALTIALNSSCSKPVARAVLVRPLCGEIKFEAENDRIYLSRESAFNLIECQKKQRAYIEYLEGVLRE